MYKRGIIRCFLPVLTAGLILLPSQAYAFVPVAIGGYGLPTAAEIAAASGGATAASVVGAVDIFAAAGFIAIGATIGYIAIDYLTTDSQPHTIRIPTTTDPLKQVPAPVGAPSTATSSLAYWYRIGNSSQPQYSTPQLACAAYHGTYNSYFGRCDSVPQADCTTAGYTGCLSSNNLQIGAGNTVVCPPGYTASGSVCNLTNSRQVIPDKACDLTRSGGSVLAMVSDPDCAAAGINEWMPIVCDGVTTICSGSGFKDGKWVGYKFTPRVDGGTTIETQKQVESGGQSQIQTNKIEVSPAGKVEATSGQVQAGSAPAQTGVAPVTPTVQGTTPLVQPQGTTQIITFPNDYARTGEAASASTGTQTRLDTLHNDLSSTTSVADPIVPVAGDMPSWGSTFTNLLSFQLPAHTSTCPQPSIDLSGMFGAGQVFTITAHCTLAAQNAAPLANAFAAMFTIMALFIVLRA